MSAEERVDLHFEAAALHRATSAAQLEEAKRIASLIDEDVDPASASNYRAGGASSSSSIKAHSSYHP